MLAIAALSNPQPRLVFFLPLGAAVAAIIAIRTRALSRSARTMAWIGLVCTALAVLGFGGAALRTWLPSIPTPVAGVRAIAPGVKDAHPEPVPIAAVAGTIAFLLKQSSPPPDQCPAELAPTSDGVIVTPAGSMALPYGASFVYANSFESCAFTITAPDGAWASWDSYTDQVSAG